MATTCTVCHDAFTSVHAFDMHRRRITKQQTPVGTPTHRCMSHEERLAIGMVPNVRGTWSSGGMTDSALARVKAQPETD